MEIEQKIKILSNLFLDDEVTEFKNKCMSSMNFKNDIIIKKQQIYLDFNINNSSEKQSSGSFLEQLEIAVQILINQNYTFVVYCSEEKQYDNCKRFVDVFKNEAITHLELKADQNWECENLVESELAIIMSEKGLLKALIIEKPFIALQIDEKVENLISINENYYINDKELNAGAIVKKIKYLSDHYELSKKEMTSFFSAEDNSFKNLDKKIKIEEETYLKIDEEDVSNQIMGEENDFEAYRLKIKQNIQTLIDQGFLTEAKDVISEYEKIVDGDIEIYSIKGVIAMMEGNLDEAESILKEGKSIEPLNSDILYNLAYLYEISTKYVLAYKSYRSLFHCVDETIKDEIKEKVKQLEEIDEVNEYLIENQDEIKAYDLIEKMQQQIKELKEITM